MSSKREPKLPKVLDGISAEEVTAAWAQDVKVTAILRRARTEPTQSKVHPDSARRNAEFMNKMRLGSERALARRIESKELVSKDELIAMLGGRRRWVNDALRAGRLFLLEAPSGGQYFPTFFADDRYDRRALGRVVQAIKGLPNQSKYYFFTRNSSRLKMTALDALAQGRTMEVIACALAFAES
jgi:hypothetical protein